MKKILSKKTKETEALEEMDRIAKMLVRRDLELTEIREELEKSRKALMSLLEGAEESRKALMNILEDVEAERRKAEGERDKTLAIITNFTDGLLVFDEENNLSLINPQAELFFDIRAKDIIGRSVSDLSDFSGFKPLAVLLGEEIKRVFRKELQLKKDLILEVSTVLILKEREKLGTLVILHDISREKKIEEMKTEFVSIAAHQLRTPLSAIKWIIKMVLDGDVGELTAEQRELLDKGYLSNERIIKLVNDLLNVSRIEEGKFGFNFAKADFQEVIVTAISGVEDLAVKNHQELTIHQPKNLPQIYMDKERMIMVMQNLLANAIKYTPEYGKIEITVQVGKQYLHVKIKDQGVGIPKEDQPKIFSKFFRAANVVKLETDGTGLGLFLVKNIIAKHNGKISLTSEEGKGTEVAFSIPISKTVDL